MREIKFRFWDELKKEMILPEYSDWEDFMIEPNGEVYVTSETTGYNPYRVKEKMVGSLEQFTGLQDSKGLDIYEGDIVFARDGFVGPRREIVWSDKNHGWAYKRLDDITNAANVSLLGKVSLINAHNMDRVEIIGNIHQTKKP